MENLISLMLGLGIFMIFIGLALYVYGALAMMTIAKKLGYDKPWLAWIPIANMFLLPILAEKEWPWGFILLIPLVNMVFVIMWTWRIYERRNYPGWLALVPIASFIPLVNFLAFPAQLVILGLVAWHDL